MREFQEIMEGYGADYEGTLSRFMGNESMYLRFLGMLSKDDSLRQLGAALDAGDLEGAFAAAHTLKGVAGNLGLTPLCQAVCGIVEPLRAGEAREDYAALYEAVRAEFLRAESMRMELEGGEPDGV